MTAAKPLVLITGAGGNIGSVLANALPRGYQAVGLDRDGDDTPGGVPVIAVDIASDREIERAAAQHPQGAHPLALWRLEPPHPVKGRGIRPSSLTVGGVGGTVNAVVFRLIRWENKQGGSKIGNQDSGEHQRCHLQQPAPSRGAPQQAPYRRG